MSKKQWTDEERAAFGAKMKAAREARQNKQPVEPEVTKEDQTPVVEEQKSTQLDDLQRQVDEVMETNALLKAALLGKSSEPSGGARVGAQGIVGEFEKYSLDKDHYPDPTPRLAQEPKLVQAVNFPFNYELQYKYDVSSYQTKAGINTREPKFMVQLNRIVVNDNGEQTDKRYVVKRLIFHEDPQAALIIARENNIEVDATDEKHFLDEMRYLRVRDWIFDIFWPKQAQASEAITEEVVGGTLFEVFTKSSTEPEEVPFDKIKSKF